VAGPSLLVSIDRRIPGFVSTMTVDDAGDVFALLGSVSSGLRLVRLPRFLNRVLSLEVSLATMRWHSSKAAHDDAGAPNHVEEARGDLCSGNTATPQRENPKDDCREPQHDTGIVFSTTSAASWA